MSRRLKPDRMAHPDVLMRVLDLSDDVGNGSGRTARFILPRLPGDFKPGVVDAPLGGCGALRRPPSGSVALMPLTHDRVLAMEDWCR